MFIRLLRFFLVCVGLLVVVRFAPKSIKYQGVLWLIYRGGVSFIKLGQILSVRSDIVGADWSKTLQQLQDKVPPFGVTTARHIFKKSCGKSIESVFTEFSPKPVGSASIAQVHKATLKNGHMVAVKILRPHIHQQFFGDIKLFYMLAYITEKVFKKSRRFRPYRMIQELHLWVDSELNLTQEAKNAKQLQDNFADEPMLYVPNIYDDFTTADVLTLEWIDGARIDDILTLEQWHLDRTNVLAHSTRIFFLQVFRDGFFHADMHPGNMFVRSDGVLCPIDFGIMGRLSQKTRIYIADCLYYLYKGEYTRVAEVHFLAGYVPSTYSVTAFAQALENIAITRDGMDWSAMGMGQLLGDLFAVTEKFQMWVRPELLLLQKTFVVAEGTGRILAPQNSMWGLISHTMEDWMRVNRGVASRIESLLIDIVTVHNTDTPKMQPQSAPHIADNSPCIPIHQTARMCKRYAILLSAIGVGIVGIWLYI